MEKLYYKISEVAEMLGENATTLRYWTNTFSKFFKLKRNSRDSRLFTAGDIETLRKISYYTHECGLSLEATARKLSQGGDETSRALQVRDALLRIKGELEQIKQTL